MLRACLDRMSALVFKRYSFQLLINVVARTVISADHRHTEAYSSTRRVRCKSLTRHSLPSTDPANLACFVLDDQESQL